MTKPPKSALWLASIVSAANAGATQMSKPSIISELPDVRTISAENAAGILRYCEKHDLVSIAVTDTVLERLTVKPKLESSPLYSAGEAGHIVTGEKTYFLGQAPGYLKSQGCDMVLQQAGQIK